MRRFVPLERDGQIALHRRAGNQRRIRLETRGQIQRVDLPASSGSQGVELSDDFSFERSQWGAETYAEQRVDDDLSPRVLEIGGR